MVEQVQQVLQVEEEAGVPGELVVIHPAVMPPAPVVPGYQIL